MINSPAKKDENYNIQNRMLAVSEGAKVVFIRPIINAECAFQELYDEYYIWIKQYISKNYQADSGRGEDIAQEIFMKLWIRRDKINLLISPRKYLIRMTNNLIFDHRRFRTRQNKMIEDLEFITNPNTRLTEEEVIYRDTKRILYQVLDQLELKTKKIFLLKQDGVKIKTIASAMGVTTRTVTNHIHLAENKIAKSLLTLNQRVRGSNPRGDT
jgi:RNA polymerase sigma factor (sigma-70 family)